MLSNIHQIYYRRSPDQASQKLLYGFLFFKTVCLLQPIKISGEAAKPGSEVISQQTV